MKIVLRHKSTGRYYRSPGKWVRRSDNALAFDEVSVARAYSATHKLGSAQPVQRLAPYLMPLLHRSRKSVWAEWLRTRSSQWYAERANRFGKN